MTCMTMKRKAKESDVEPLTATDYMEALPHGMTGLSVRVQREVLQKWYADEQKIAALEEEVRRMQARWVGSSKRCVGCGYCCQSTAKEQRGEGHRGCL